MHQRPLTLEGAAVQARELLALLGRRRVNSARRAPARSIERRHVPLPRHAPVQPANRKRLAGRARSVTGTVNVTRQRRGQAMPAGELVTFPLPLTVTTT